MKTLHANKDYVLHNGQVYIFITPETSIDGLQNYSNPFIFADKMIQVVAATDKSLPVKHIDRSVFVKPADVEELWYNYFGGIPANQEYTKAFIELYNANPNQFTLEQLKLAYNAGLMSLKTFDEVLEAINLLSLPETIQCDDNYENLKPIWKQIN